MASGLGAGDHNAHNAPRPLASGRLGEGGTWPRPATRCWDTSCKVSDMPPTVAPEVRTQRAQNSRVHGPWRLGTQSLLSPPSHRPLVTRPWSPSAGYSPCVHAAPGRSPCRTRASFVPTHPAPDSRHIAAVPEVSGPGLERGASPTSPPTSGCSCPLDEGRPLTCTPPVPQTPQQEILYLLGSFILRRACPRQPTDSS